MKISSVLFVSGALVFALGGAFIVRGMTVTPAKPVHPKVDIASEPAPIYTPVLTAGRDLHPGDFIGANDVYWKQVDREYPGEFYFKKESGGLTEIYGSTVNHLVPKGELLSYDVVVKPGQPGFIASVLTPGKRAVAIPTDAVSSSSGLVQAGDHVDVILGLEDKQSGKNSGQDNASVSFPLVASQTLVTNVRVLALNNKERSALRMKEDKEKTKEKAVYPETVTLEVTPKQAERLTVARELGKLQLVIRAVNDSATEEASTVELAASDVTTLSDTTDVYKQLQSPAPTVIQYQGSVMKAAQVSN
ncbi:Flp pilus assembly protein CpaB [Vibrio porteresiae]|uniref:Flp pilus assembly protein CpaB n=1 Tax=Vibrio porteresiae DSM 19223 TaxID=1123496 RepID=A0ABZ0QIY9_9VIBR|nr:Flp pilus assembly protein CpaB [Vibrio porteresiae]WPC75682.1 Flp pilus assembly protein CpaB [Vibrio porteresiae DSM 19223]